MLDKISRSKTSTVDAQNQGTWMHLTSLHYLGIRFGGVLKEPIKALLQEIKKQFEKISKKIIVENEVRVIQGILDLIKEVLRFQDNYEDDLFISENEQSIICGEQQMNQFSKNIENQYKIALTKFLTTKYSGINDTFNAFQRDLSIKMADYNFTYTENILENICKFNET